jgi:hypothetical protein
VVSVQYPGEVRRQQSSWKRENLSLQNIRTSGVRKDKVVDAQLTDLNITQLALAIEFNPLCLTSGARGAKVRFGDTPGDDKQRSGTMPVVSDPPATGRRPGKAATVTGKTEDNSTCEFPEGDRNGLINRDLAALDRLDLDSITAKIRSSCISCVEQLELGHLMEEEKN